MNNDFFGHEWGDLPMIFTSDEVKSENHWQITSRIFDRLTNIRSHHEYSIAHFAIVARDGIF